MTDREFDVLDELYFVTPFHELREHVGLPEEELKEILIILSEKGWLKCFGNMDEELPLDDINLETEYKKYFYLASKEGLLAHNRS